MAYKFTLMRVRLGRSYGRVDSVLNISLATQGDDIEDVSSHCIAVLSERTTVILAQIVVIVFCKTFEF